MTEIMIGLAKVMPTTVLAKMLHNQIHQYLENPTKENEQHLFSLASLMCMNLMDKDRGLDETLEEYEKIKQWMDIIPKSS
jgi:hypothetical protein